MPKITNFNFESESDLRRQTNGTRQDLTIGGLDGWLFCRTCCEKDFGSQSSTSQGAVALHCSTVSAKITNFKNESESDLRRQINGSRQDLTIGGLGAPDHVAIFKHRIKSVSGAGDQLWGKN